METFIKCINTKAKFFHHEFAISIPKVNEENELNVKEFDIVFFARVSKEKGIEDLLHAVFLVKRKIPNVSVRIIGPSSNEYLIKLKSLVNEYDIKNNVTFFGSLPTIADVHAIAGKAKICVLPTYFDTIPGTIVESMLMKIPCIAYPVGGIPTLNAKMETIVLVDTGDIYQLADSIYTLLEDNQKRKELANNAYGVVMKRWDDNLIKMDIIKAYHEVIRFYEKNV
jgi:glycosyltransferase involved in cell wall biosynthesis